MDSYAVLSADLAELTAPFYPVDLNKDRLHQFEHNELAHLVASIRDDAALAVSSLLGVSVTLTLDGHDVTLNSMAENVESRQVASSLQLTLAAISSRLGGRVVLYAAAPGAFVELSDELRHSLALGDGECRLDENLTPNMTSGLTGARELSSINQAIGFLIHQGRTPENARADLRAAAAAEQCELHLIAQRILDNRM